MNLQTAKFISAPSKDGWSQVYIDDHFLAVIKIEKEADPASRAGEIISRLRDYYTRSQGRVLERLENSLRKIQEETEDLKLEMVIGLVWNEVLYLSILNKGKVVLLRNDSLVTILKGEEGLVTCSGFLKEDDIFVLGTERFFEVVPREILKVNLENKEPEKVVEILAPIVHGEKKDGGVAGMIIKCPMPNAKYQIKERLSRFFKEFVSRPRAIYLPRKKPESRKQRMMMTIAIASVILLLVSVIFGFFKKRKEEETKRFKQILGEIEYKYKEGKELVDLNPILARTFLSESLELVKRNRQYKQLENLEKEIERELEKVLREYELTEVSVFLDLGLIKKDLKGVDLDFWKKKMVVLGEDGTVTKIDLNKKAEIKGLVEKGKLVTLWGEKVFVLGEKIVEVENKTEMEKDWGEIVGFESFAGNLYLLDKGESEVWKYPLIEGGIGAKRKWFGPGVEFDLTEAVDFAIDGDIWILRKDGKILKFSSGAPKSFALSGLDKELNNSISLYTDEDCKKIYVLDKGNKRIVVLLKSGEYDSQYLWEGIKEIDDIGVSEEEKKILLLSREKIFEIEIR